VSLQYVHYLIPVAESLSFRPEAKAIQELAARLRDAGWLSGTASSCRVQIHSSAPGNTVVRLDQLAAELAALVAPDVTLVVQLPLAEPTGVSESPFHECSGGSALDLSRCQVLELFYSGSLCMVPPDNVSGSLMPCPTCSANLSAPGLPVAGGVVPNAEVLLAVCSACGTPIVLDALVGSSPSGVDGTRKVEPAPFFRFALCLTSDAPPEDPATTEPGMQRLLEQCMGVSFRSMGRWS
jgi:hypothetical protein